MSAFLPGGCREGTPPSCQPNTYSVSPVLCPAVKDSGADGTWDRGRIWASEDKGMESLLSPTLVLGFLPDEVDVVIQTGWEGQRR